MGPSRLGQKKSIEKIKSMESPDKPEWYLILGGHPMTRFELATEMVYIRVKQTIKESPERLVLDENEWIDENKELRSDVLNIKLADYKFVTTDKSVPNKSNIILLNNKKTVMQ